MINAEDLLDQFGEAQFEDDQGTAESLLEKLRAEHPDTRERSVAEIGWRLFVEEEEQKTPVPELLTRTDAHGSLFGWLEQHVERWPDDADVRHEYGAALFELERDEEAVAQWLVVRKLDELNDEEQGIGGEEDETFLIETAAEVIGQLPAEFGERLGSVPVVVEPRPSEALVREGFDPRAYGMFEGPDQEDVDGSETPPAPTRIVLFLSNLAADFPEDAELQEQIAVTVLHEVGHYFGLEEEDMERLGLD